MAFIVTIHTSKWISLGHHDVGVGERSARSCVNCHIIKEKV